MYMNTNFDIIRMWLKGLGGGGQCECFKRLRIAKDVNRNKTEYHIFSHDSMKVDNHNLNGKFSKRKNFRK